MSLFHINYNDEYIELKSKKQISAPFFTFNLHILNFLHVYSMMIELKNRITCISHNEYGFYFISVWVSHEILTKKTE